MIRARWLTALLAALLVSLSLLGVSAQEIPGGLPAGVASTVAGGGWTPATAVDGVAYWDAGADSFPEHGIKGGYLLSAASDQHFARTSGSIPHVSAGAPSYPFTVVSWCDLSSAAGTNVLFATSDGTTGNRLVLYQTAGSAAIYAEDGGGNTNTTLGAGITGGRWACIVGVFAAADSRAIYTDSATAGATSAVSRSPTGLSALHIGRNPDATFEWDSGRVAYTAILPVDLSGAGNATIRQNIFNGADPEVASSTTATALWHFDNDNGVDAKGSFDLTASGTPTAQNNLIVLRDQVGIYHQRATTSAPTYDATLFSNRGGVTFTAASSQFLVCESTPITAAPLQMYAVAQCTQTTATQTVLWLGDKDAADQWWDLRFDGASVGDPISFTAANVSVNIASTTAGYTADTTRLLWGMESSSTSRAVRLDGANEGTETTSTAPAGADRIALGAIMRATPTLFADAKLGAAWLLNSTDVTERASAHAWVDTNFGTSLP